MQIQSTSSAATAGLGTSRTTSSMSASTDVFQQPLVLIGGGDVLGVAKDSNR
jgi:hypothetical protein